MAPFYGRVTFAPKIWKSLLHTNTACNRQACHILPLIGLAVDILLEFPTEYISCGFELLG